MTVCESCGRGNRLDARFCDSCGAELAVPVGRETRKTVTILFCDVVGSTELAERSDPELVRSIMTGYFDVARPIIERHGGTVEKFIGDAVMAVFGVPVVHEDDALRAVRAAAELRDALGRHAVTIRIGVATGGALTGFGQTLGTGDVFNLAARLQTSAAAGDVLMSEVTLQMVRDAVAVEAVPPLAVKGKRDRVIAWRLIDVQPDPGVQRGFSGEFVGRRRELRLVMDAFERCRAERRCHLVTVLGEAGIGKSRLVSEVIGSAGVPVGRGRCRPYGEGITYLPLAEAFSELAGNESAEDWLRHALCNDDVDGGRAYEVVASTVGYVIGTMGAGDEVAWAVGRAVEAAAVSGPRIIVFDDIQWAEPALLDVIEHMVDWIRGSSVLVVCLARTALLESRPGWGGGKVNATMLLLEPLTAEESVRQVDALTDGRALDSDLRGRIVETAGGNPLFAEQMVALVESGSERDVTVPASVQALLAARIDALGPLERSVLEAAAVEGQEFHREATAQLVGGDVDSVLRGLVRQELVDPRGGGGLDATYAFRHLLIRDAAYDAIALARRVELHTAFADWWERSLAEDEAQFYAMLGYHLDTACRCYEKLGHDSSMFPDLAVRAGVALAKAGTSAWRRWDASSRSLLVRALELLPAGHEQRPEALLLLAYSHLHADGAAERTAQLVDVGLNETAALGDQVMHLRFDLARSECRLWLGEAGPIESRRRQAEDAIATFERVGEVDGIVQALGLISLTEQDAMQGERARRVADRMLELGRRTGQSFPRDVGARALALALLDGPEPIDQAIVLCDQLIASTPGPGRATPMQFKAELLAAREEFDAARVLLDAAREITAAMGAPAALDILQWTDAAIDALAGRWVAAETALREVHQALAGTEERWTIGGICALLGEVLLEQGRVDEALEQIETARAHAAPRSIYYQSWWRRAMARVDAQYGRHDAAEALAREAVAMIAASDWLYFKAETHMALAEVLRHAGREDEVVETASQALALCRAKQHRVGQRRIQAFLDSPLAARPNTLGHRQA